MNCPTIPRNPCGRQKSLQRTEVKKLPDDWEPLAQNPENSPQFHGDD
jgi:hypothetical protein